MRERDRWSTFRSALYRRGTPVLITVLIILILFLLSQLIVNVWLVRPADPLGEGIMYDTTFALSGPPSVSVDFLNQVLAFYDSPAAGKGQSLYDLGVKYTIDPVYALAFFLQESRLGTTGVARVTHSLGNIRATPGHPSYHGYRKYQTWEDGFADWYQLIKALYIQQWKLVTVSKIVPVYAPSADHNDVETYITVVERAVTVWRSGSVQA